MTGLLVALSVAAPPRNTTQTHAPTALVAKVHALLRSTAEMPPESHGSGVSSDPPVTAADDLSAMAEALEAAGYLVVKIPPCKIKGGHGRHSLVTRTASCEGAEPIPHGFMAINRGLLGYWVTCSCGHAFRDFSGDDSPSPWELHKAEHGVVEAERA